MSADLTAPARTRRTATSPLIRSLAFPATIVGLLLLLFVLLIAIVGPFFAPYSPQEVIGLPSAGPMDGAPLGTDYLGRDVLSRVLHGGVTVVWMSITAAVIGVTLGAIVGLVSAYFAGPVDSGLMRTMDVILAFPQLILALLFVTFLGSSLWLIVVLVGITWMPQVARVTRSVALNNVHREYVEWAESIGVSRWRIVTREILPNISGPLTVEFGLKVTWSIALVASLSFLGFGVQPPNPDWGLMVSENRAALTLQPWPVVIPTLLIALFALGANSVSEGVGRAVARLEGRSQ